MKKIAAILVGTGLVLSTQQADAAKDDDDAKKAKWALVWSDEFDKGRIDPTKWGYDLGNWIIDGNGNPVTPGWGNNEKQYYTDAKDNSFVRDGKLVIRAEKERISDSLGTYDYTSAKLKTKGLFSKTYGRYEIKAKLPAGKGLWPAFWMLPEEDRYGAWASSGEIDVMEAWGSKPDRVAGTIHYGENWPNNKYTGKEYHFPEGSTIKDWHTYAVEWEPGELRWYVDGNLYQTQNDWYSKGLNTATNYSYPAPFDQNFYLVMNLAVGGWFDGETDASTPFPAEMEVEYVRVYDLKNGKYREAIEPTYEPLPLPEGAKQPQDGNLIYDTSYLEPITRVDQNGQSLDPTYWNFLQLPDFGGKGDVSVKETTSGRVAHVTIEEPGSYSYSLQMIQQLALAQGGRYRVSFDANSDAERQMVVKVGAGAERGYTKYSNEENIRLTAERQSYAFTFDMTGETDLAARLEFNLGNGGRSPIEISNVRVEQIPRGEIDENATKPALGDGNLVYNGTFDQGAMDRLTYWQFDSGLSKSLGAVDGLRQFTYTARGKKGLTSTLTQRGIQLKEGGQYILRFDAKSDGPALKVALRNQEGNVDYLAAQPVALKRQMTTFEVPFTMTNGTDLLSQLVFLYESGKGTVSLDDVELIDVTPVIADPNPLKNGSFEDGLAAWGQYVHYDAQAVIEAVEGAARIQIGQEGQERWSVLLEQGGLDLKKGKTYELSFRASSSVARDIEVTIENAVYSRYLSEKVELGQADQTFRFELTMPQDDQTGLKFLLGKSDSSPLGAHEIKIDDVVLRLK